MPAEFTGEHEAMQMCLACGHTYLEHITNVMEVDQRPCGLCSCETFVAAVVESIAPDGTVTDHGAPIVVHGRDTCEDGAMATVHAIGGTMRIGDTTLPYDAPVADIAKVDDFWAKAEAGDVPRTSAKQPPKRTNILSTAASLITGERQTTYGDPTPSYERLARLWSEVLGMPVTAEQVALCLIQLKVSRLVVSPDHADSWVDICGYAALGGEIADTHRGADDDT